MNKFLKDGEVAAVVKLVIIVGLFIQLCLRPAKGSKPADKDLRNDDVYSVENARNLSSTGKCPLSDLSIRCRILRARQMFYSEIKKFHAEAKRVDIKRVKRQSETLSKALLGKAVKDNDRKISIDKSTKTKEEQNKAKKKKLQEKFKARWRFWNGRYMKLPVCNTTAATTKETTHALTTTKPKPNLKYIKLTKQQKEILVVEHNKERRAVDPPATNMKHMSWDEELSWVAEQHTNSCSYREQLAFIPVESGVKQPDIIRHSVLDAEIGFNWFAWKNTRGLPKTFVSDVMTAWMSEKAYYDIYTRVCKSVCRHYLQVIWANTFKIGCSASSCGRYILNGVTWYKTTVLLCAYAPRGNVVEFESAVARSLSYITPPRTRPPYKYGPTCEDCGAQLDTNLKNSTKLAKSSEKVVAPRSDTSYAKYDKWKDVCVKKLCKNRDRDKEIPFIAPPSPTTTTFSWTTTLTSITRSSPGIPCVNSNDLDIQSSDDGDDTIIIVEVPSKASYMSPKNASFVIALCVLLQLLVLNTL
ncbi:uncharacterized protein LOC143457619 [Clavelina lepadiformis]|uniref:SCP domain-containing protein n=1 Tax=Clavelina lepadiformis TaxID=159417 RepID=A0ABP0FVT0_CLALP